MKSSLDTLNRLWSRIEKYNSQLPESIIQDTESKILNLDFQVFSFNKKIPQFQRLTINKELPNPKNERLSEAKWLYPRDPNTVNKFGRMNLKKETIFYGSFILPTLINEVKPDIGDIVTVSTWSLKDPKTEMLVFPSFKTDEFDPSFLSAQNIFLEQLKIYTKDQQSIILAQQNLFASVFSKNFEFKSKFVFTASIAKNILSKVYEGQIEAIIYPSVQDTSKIVNIAIKPNVVLEKYRLSFIREYKILDNSEDLKVQEITGIAKGVRSGLILWD